MKLKSCVAAAVSAAITLCSLSTLAVSNAETEQQTYTVTYNVDTEIFDAEDLALFESYELEEGDYVDIVDLDVVTDTLTLSGWSYDGVFLYEPGDYFRMPAQDIVLEPVWIDEDSPYYNVSYNYENEEEGWSVMNPDAFPNFDYHPGSAIQVCTATVMRDGYTQIGWRYNDLALDSSKKFIMPENDVVFEPNWHQNFHVHYEAGDVDRINGTASYVFTKYEGLTFDLADSSRLSRSGFTLSGWLSDLDGQVYKTGAQFTMPSSDVHFTAVWTPKTYTVVFKVNNGTSSTIKLSGETDTAIIAPECTYTKEGYVFAGWDYNGTIYQPGDEFIIPGALPGLGIQLTGVWVEPGSLETVDSLTLVEARKQYVNGEITAEELRAVADSVLGK
ncbi:MAG: InlB B-repeat-containing protein [Ruminococcus sp.]|nr:InlB B-repeat-containing protein [Ruminococcus sp.]